MNARELWFGTRDLGFGTRDSGLGTRGPAKTGAGFLGSMPPEPNEPETIKPARYPTYQRVPSSESRVPSSAKQGGFTLIEVMAAFAIFAVLFGIILQILSTSISNTRRSGDFTQAALLAQSQLDMVGIEALPQPGTSSGSYTEKYRWKLVIEPYRIEDARGVNYDELPIDLYYVGLTVYWGEGRSERSALFETLRSVDRFYAERQEQGR